MTSCHVTPVIAIVMQSESSVTFDLSSQAGNTVNNFQARPSQTMRVGLALVV